MLTFFLLCRIILKLRSTESTRVEICPLQTVSECGQCRGNWGLFLHFGGWGLHCSLLHVLCLQHGISWILEKDTDLSPEAHRKHHGGWRQIPAGNCNSNCQPSSLIMPGLHQCTKCSKRTFTLRKLIHHIGLVHAHDPHFSITCGISNCQSAFSKYHSFRWHVYRKHKDNISDCSEVTITFWRTSWTHIRSWTAHTTKYRHFAWKCKRPFI